MKQAIINDVHLAILTKKEAKELRIDKECTPLGNGLLLHGLRTKGDYVKASGLEELGEVDYTTDQRLWPASKSKVDEIRSWYVSYYPYDKPLSYFWQDLRELVPAIAQKVMEA